MSAPTVPPATPVGRAPSSGAPTPPAADRARTVTANSALGHALRRLAHETAHPGTAYVAEFESSIGFEPPVGLEAPMR